MTFDFSGPGRILFGTGRLLEAAREIGGWSSRVLVVTGSDPARAAGLLAALESTGVTVFVHCLRGEPKVSDVEIALEAARKAGVGAVVAVGGGSVLDLGKAVAALAALTTRILDHLEVVGQGLPIPGPGLPCAAFPTTAGTGSEATRNSVIQAGAVKVSLRGPQLMPKLAVVDPSFALGLPRDQTAWSGMDALVQLLEPLVSRFSNPIADGFCRTGIPLSMRGLPAALLEPSDLAARTDLALASLLSGLALANAKLGSVHGLAAPIGGMFPAPHGAVCARLLVPAWKANLLALDRVPEARPKFLEASRLLCGRDGATLEDGLAAATALADLAAAPGLAHWGVRPSDIPSIREAGMRASSMKGNPVELQPAEIDRILLEAL